ncbi:hypothetical protein GTW51_10030 [Aurantimonas aggregata]|uniref:Uncharacterized protein n=1 Tax=Aurantimonas aggregata TaxID=2047720 RepID=A0A6L9MGV0_9HYPH|nr:hypothetical protein [Aurantimonas aggregata]NDV87039.1 hypothetical protein [Aurantimonas aggregata]
MVAVASAFMSLIGGGSAATVPAAAGTTAAGTAAATATTGSTIASILQGTATALSVFAGIGAANTEADALEMAAGDAEREKALETLQGVERRTSIKRAMMDAIGEQNVATAASGVDLSFGTPSQARREAFREADLGIETANGTEQTRVSRLTERAANYRSRAKSTRRAGLLTDLGQGAEGASNILLRG